MAKHTLTIEFDEDTKQVHVEGPLKNPLLAYGMVECAKDVIRKMNEVTTSAAPAERKIVGIGDRIPRLPGLRNRNGGS